MVSFVEDAVDGVDERGADSDFLGELVDGSRVGNAFGDHAESLLDVFEWFSFAYGESDTVVARVGGVAGGDEVSDTGKASEGFGATTEGGAEADHFG